MPGKGGMRPVQSRRSVPVLMPLKSMSTTQSAAVGAVSASSLTARRRGSCSTTANRWKHGAPGTSPVNVVSV
jgi:hypothetical protein